MNRERAKATFHHPVAVRAYREFYRFIRWAKHLIGRNGDGSGLLLDIHGQSHREGWIELGYAINRGQLNNNKVGDDQIESLVNLSSIRSIAQKISKKSSKQSFEDILRGSKSLGRYLTNQDRSYRVVPSPKIPSPGRGGYFCCNYIVRNQGSRSSGKIDAIQIETHKKYRTSEVTYKDYARKLAAALREFMKHYE